MNKKEALAILEVSERTLTNYVKNNRLSVRYEKGATGKIAIYDDEQVHILKEELNDPASPAIGVRVATPERQERIETVRVESPVIDHKPEGMATLARIERQLPEGVGQMAELAILVGNHIAENINDALSRQQLATQPLLTLPEASAYSKVPERMLRDAARDGELASRKIGRGLKVRRVDVDAWIEKLYKG